jgi:hypothetical protein
MKPVDTVHMCGCGSKVWEDTNCRCCGKDWTERPADFHNIECDGQAQQLAAESR